MHTHQIPWNKGRLLGQKPPLKPKEIWSIRIRLQRLPKVSRLASAEQCQTGRRGSSVGKEQ